MVVRKGVAALLSERYPFFEIWEADSIHKTRTLLNSEKFDLLILDLNLQDQTTEELIVEVLAVQKDLPVVIYSMFPCEIMEGPMVKLGVRAYVSKSDNMLMLRDAIDEALMGRRRKPVKVTPPNPEENLFAQLSPKELSVMFGILEGKTNAMIAGQMNLRAPTIATFKKRIFEKLAVKNSTELLKLALKFKMYHIS